MSDTRCPACWMTEGHATGCAVGDGIDLGRLTQHDERQRRYDVRDLYRRAQQTDPWPGEPLTVGTRWYEGEVPDQGYEGSSVGYAMAGVLDALRGEPKRYDHQGRPVPWDGHACTAMLPAPHGRACNWCGTLPARDVSHLGTEEAIFGDEIDD